MFLKMTDDNEDNDMKKCEILEYVNQFLIE